MVHGQPVQEKDVDCDVLPGSLAECVGLTQQLRFAVQNPLGRGVADLLNELDASTLRMYDRVLLTAATKAGVAAAEGRHLRAVAGALRAERDASLGDASPHIKDPGPEGMGEEPSSEEDMDRRMAEWEDPVEMAARCRREELRLGMRLSPAGMYAVAEQARQLDGPYVRARELMLAGVMTRQQWHVLRTSTRAVPEELLAEVLDLVLPKVATSTTKELQRHIDRVLAKLLPDRGALEHAKARKGRRVEVWHDQVDTDDADGRTLVRESSLRAVSDPTQVHRIAQLVDGHARWMRDKARSGAKAAEQDAQLAMRAAWKQHGEGSREHVAALEVWQAARKHRQQVVKQGLAAWKFDALADLAERGTLAAHDGAPLIAKEREVLPVVVLSAETAFGLANNPGELRGYGTLPAPVLRDLVAGAKSWLLALVDHTGQTLSVQRYKPTAAIRDWLIVTKPTCVAPWCDSPVEWAEDDHLEEWRPPPDPEDPNSKPAGGPTSEDNLHPECKTTHQLKTHRHLDVVRDDDGGHRVITHSGHQYRREPHRLLPEIGQGWGTTGDPDEPPPF
ncbi:MAG: hypothetical protein ACTHQ3_20370 [Motilibacteraceae bacterium]